MRYGDDGTIHRSEHVDVEVHDGRVVGVWFRCCALPFEARAVRAERAADLERLYAAPRKGLTAVVLRNEDGSADKREPAEETRSRVRRWWHALGLRWRA